MWCGKCQKSKSLCPVSFGLALGITCALAVIIWCVWVANYGLPAGMAGHMVPPSTFAGISLMAGWCLLKGFVFGLVLALIYDFIACYCKSKCCKKSDGSGTCGCGPSCSCGNKNDRPNTTI